MRCAPGVAVEILGAGGVVDPPRAGIGGIDEQVAGTPGEEGGRRQAVGGGLVRLDDPLLLAGAVDVDLQAVGVDHPDLAQLVGAGDQGLGGLEQIAAALVVDRLGLHPQVVALEGAQHVVGLGHRGQSPALQVRQQPGVAVGDDRGQVAVEPGAAGVALLRGDRPRRRTPPGRRGRRRSDGRAASAGRSRRAAAAARGTRPGDGRPRRRAGRRTASGGRRRPPPGRPAGAEGRQKAPARTARCGGSSRAPARRTSRSRRAQGGSAAWSVRYTAEAP